MKNLTPQEEVEFIQKKLGHLTLDAPTVHWLDTQSKKLNAVLGSRDKGIPYGKLAEAFGWESHGKTLLALFLAGIAQRDGAIVAWVDLENSFDEVWARVQGCDPEKVYLFRTGLIQEGKTKEPRLMTAQEVIAEVEEWMRMQHKKGFDNPGNFVKV